MSTAETIGVVAIAVLVLVIFSLVAANSLGAGGRKSAAASGGAEDAIAPGQDGGADCSGGDGGGACAGDGGGSGK